MHEAEPDELWSRLRNWATRWQLPPPSLSDGWLYLPPSYRTAAVNGAAITRPLFEPPGDDAAARDLETHSGIALPADLRALYAVHGGSYAPLLPYGMCLLPYEAMLTCWEANTALAEEFSRTEPDPEFVASGTHYEWPFHRCWLPVAYSDVSTLVLDFQPGPQGTVGQVLFPVNEIDHVVAATSLTDFLRRWLAALDGGEVRFGPDHGYAVPQDPDSDYTDLFIDVP